jgi:hypothetical protein
MEEKIKRDTNRILFEEVMKLVKQDPEWPEIEKIIDYANAGDCSGYDPELTDYHFEYIPKLAPGASDGIYIDCVVEGHYDCSNSIEARDTLVCGTIKTLWEGREGMIIMGKLCGLITYYADCYINQNIDRYTPPEGTIM